MEKICTKCKIPKDLIEFNNRLKSNDGKSNECRQCAKIRYVKLKENNPQIYLKYNKSWYESNKEKTLKKSHEYYDKNKEKLIKNNTIRSKIRRDKDVNFKLIQYIRTRLYNSIKYQNTTKGYKTIKLLGCTSLELKQYLESKFKPEMNWENYGLIWEIDHVLSCANFDLTKLEEQSKCFHYTNLQPLFKTTNIAESFGYNDEIGNRNKGKKING